MPLITAPRTVRRTFFLTLGISVLAAMLAGVTVGSTTNMAAAQSLQDAVITAFDADYELTRDDPQGTLTITESIDISFSEQSRGIERAIPNTFQSNDLNLEVLRVQRDGNTEPYIVYQSNDNSVIRIGDERTFIDGRHTYEIEYKLENVIAFYEGHDELYWDINGDQWLQTFEGVSVKISSEASAASIKTVCFVGRYGENHSDCSVKQNTQSFESSTLRSLEPGETLTVVAAYDKGYFTPRSYIERHAGKLASIPFVALLLGLVRSAHTSWRTHGQDYATNGLTAPFFDRPKGLSVMQAGYVHENSLTAQHVSATIIDLAIRGHIKISERTGTFRGTKHDITLLRPIDSSLSRDEQELLRSLVGEKQGATVEIESKKHALHATFERLSSIVDDLTTQDGFYELSPVAAKRSLMPHVAGAAFGVVIGFVLAGFTSGISLVASLLAGAVILAYRYFMTKRSRSGNSLLQHMQGLRLYLDTAEKDRMQQQDAVSAPLAEGAGQPVRSVEFFEKLLPFAVAMGVEKSWAKAFRDIYEQPPEWYAGNWNSFTTTRLVNSIGATNKATATSFAPPKSSSGSGFSSGGGFAGGGGGGGGGGVW